MSPRSTARVAGLLYLIVIGAGSATLVMGPALFVPGDAAATANNIVNSEQLFRVRFAVHLVATAAYVGVTAVLYEVLKPAGKTLSIVAAFFGLAGCVTGAAISLNGLAPLVLLKGSSYLSAFSPEQLNALTMIWLRLSGVGNSIVFAFFGLYCLTLGFLVVGAKFLPRILGVLLAITGVAWLSGSLANLLFPEIASQIPAYAMPIAIFGESAFTLWLLIVGVNDAKWKAQAGTT